MGNGATSSQPGFEHIKTSARRTGVGLHSPARRRQQHLFLRNPSDRDFAGRVHLAKASERAALFEPMSGSRGYSEAETDDDKCRVYWR